MTKLDEKLREIAEREGAFSDPCVTNTMCAMRRAAALGAREQREADHAWYGHDDSTGIKAPLVTDPAPTSQPSCVAFRSEGECDCPEKHSEGEEGGGR